MMNENKTAGVGNNFFFYSGGSTLSALNSVWGSKVIYPSVKEHM